MFYNLLIDTDMEVTVGFDDVPKDAWYSKAVNTLASIGIINGVGDGYFQPDRNITRAEFAAIAMRFTDGEITGDNVFGDISEDSWYYEAVIGAASYGWINGYMDGNFHPDDPTNRAQAAAIVNRMLNREADRGFINNTDNVLMFDDLTTTHWAYYQIVEASIPHDYVIINGNEYWLTVG